MKSRLSTLDIVTLIQELRKKLIGLRVDQVYDVDRKTYLIKLNKPDVKRVLLIESSSRFHTTNFEWPKNPAPSGFTMKLRKHLKNKRVECIDQVGADRVVHFQFGAEEFAFHLFLELYDKGNIILTDHTFNILTLVRPHVQGEDRFGAHEKYVTDKAKTRFSLDRADMVTLMVENPGKSLREIFLSKVEFGPGLFSHVLKNQGLTPQMKLPADEGLRKELEEKLFGALEEGRLVLENEMEEGGFISYKTSLTTTFDKENKAMKSEEILLYDQFNPLVLLGNFDEKFVLKFPTLDEAVDDFFSKIESQKLDMKQVTQEKDALKKLDRVKEDQVKRLSELKKIQEVDKKKAELIMFNQGLIEQTIAVLRSMIANQIPWDEIWTHIKEAQDKGDLLAKRIIRLQLLKTQFTMSLSDPYGETEESCVEVDIDLDLSAYANASKYFVLKKASAKKEERTLESQEKAFKSTEKRTMSTLREVAMIQQIKKARKVFWFEKFHWFISSENYLVLGGHDAQQNELLVKRYMGAKDVYLHADAHGAPTFLIKNESGESIPPKTLNEACCLAVCYSGSWESKIIGSAWWVWGEQVSKSAPTGEYLPTGSFMIRGKKNYLPPSQLVLGFGFLFRVSEESIPRHVNERPRRTHQDSESGEGGQGVNEEVKVKEEEKVQGVEETIPPQHSDGLEEVEENEEEEEEVEVEDEESEEFPDTRVSLDLGRGEDDEESRSGRTRTMSTMSTMSVMSTGTTSSHLVPDTEGDGENDKGFIVETRVLPNFELSALGLKKGKKKEGKKDGGKGKGGSKGKQTQGQGQSQTKGQGAPVFGSGVEKEVVVQQTTTVPVPVNKSKRGQHGRQKKMKEKYKDQDEEERELRMRLLQSAGKTLDKEPPSKSEQLPPSDTSESPSGTLLSLTLPSKPKFQPRPPPVPKEESQGQGDGGEGEEGDTPLSHLDLLNCLTGCPAEEDELMFAIPVVAPYSTLQNYKFRIKMLPGSTKRGKAARSALESFLRDKMVRQREKDLLKSVKDQDLAKNFPGKVKLSVGGDKK